jgi:hypothetical protein
MITSGKCSDSWVQPTNTTVVLSAVAKSTRREGLDREWERADSKHTATLEEQAVLLRA